MAPMQGKAAEVGWLRSDGEGGEVAEELLGRRQEGWEEGQAARRGDAGTGTWGDAQGEEVELPADGCAGPRAGRGRRRGAVAGAGARAAGEEAGQGHAPVHAGPARGAVPAARAAHALPPSPRPPPPPHTAAQATAVVAALEAPQIVLRKLTFFTCSSRRSSEENVKIVEMDSGEQPARRGGARGGDRQFSSVEYHHGGRSSPAPSAMTELSPRASSWHLEDRLSFGTAHSSPHSHSHNAPAAMTEPAGSLY
uniref:Uncharacterized protein n=1 Tax=Aegilops tauschii TaxID=37682 RepID=M8B1C4_AEGTA